jgi:glycosyltransferase involved in cell wall biosynthesis
VANIEPRKNQRLLAQVARHMELDLLLLGRARDHEFLASCLAAGGPRVRHLGFLDHADPLLKSAYRACEVFLLPSLLETPGLAGLEAAAQGAKLVITRVGSTTEYFQDLVSYVDPNDARSLQHGIETQRAAQGDQRLRTHVLSNFTWTHAAKALIEAYSRTLLATNSVR